MLPWKTIIKLQRAQGRPVFLQLADAIIREIKSGLIKPGTKMPGTRVMAGLLKLNRQTVVKSFDELYSQGWLVSSKSKGTFVSEELPEIHPAKISTEDNRLQLVSKAGFEFERNEFIHDFAKPEREIQGFHDGPDVRLIPTEIMGRNYKSILQRKRGLLLLSYIDVIGTEQVRQSVSGYLNESRGLRTEADNILMTRGTQMAMYLLAQVLLKKGDRIITTSISFRYADLTFMQAGAELLRVPVDDEGMDVDEIAKICSRKKIRAVYVNSHHHYPTTVTLSAGRRMKLLQLAEKYNFVVIEDDYDYEFHYDSSPILPLASADRTGMVIYIGSFSKTLAPGIRIGYVAAPPDLVNELGKLRQIIDAQGDAVMEQVVANMINDGEIRRHMKKGLKIYKERRDFMVSTLRAELSDVIQFHTPEGGLAIWAKFDKRIPVPELSIQLRKKELILSKGLLHDLTAGKKLNSTRIGFGWMNIQEAGKAIGILKSTIRKME